MQKKLIALAVAGLVSAPAFAQSNVTIYGLVDMGFSYRGDHFVDGVGSKTAIDSGVANGSRLGFRGTEDLGNGLKAGFVLEQGLYADRGVSAQGGRAFGRQSFVSLAGGFGEVRVGRQYTMQNMIHGAYDPFGDGTVGKVSNVYEQTAGGRLDNSLVYISPNFSGLTVIGAYSTNADGQEDIDNDGDARVWGISPMYNNGPLSLAANYHQVKVEGQSGKNKVWDLAAAYDFGVAKVSAIYGQNKYDAEFTGLGDDEKAKYWMLGVTAPVGAAGKVMASYVSGKYDFAGDDYKVGQWALGYTHALSKRTDVYAAYADINNKDDVLLASSGDATNGGEGYQKGFNLGVRHRF